MNPLYLCLPLLLFTIFSSTRVRAQTLDKDHYRALAPRSIGPAGMSGRVTGIDVDPRDKDRIYVATASGGLWRSTNGATSFEPIFDDQRHLSIGAVAVSESNPDIVWAGTGEGNPRNSANYGGGIYKSSDGGDNWEPMGLEGTRHIHRIKIHPDNPDIVYVGAQGNMWAPNPERGVYRTTDGGQNWERVLYIDEGTGIADLVMDPVNPDKLIAATWTFDRDPWFFNSGGPGSGIWVTTDGGDNWERRTAKDGLPKGNLGRIGLAIAPSRPDVVYALVEETGKNGLYKSTDGGTTFQLLQNDDVGTRPFYYAEIYVDPQNENRLFNVHTWLERSEDGGKSFDEIANYGNDVHPDHHALWINPDNPDYILEGNDGGMNISHDGGDTWRFVGNLPLAQFYHINYDMSYPYRVGGGMQDNGSWVGPNTALKSGGITEADWQEVYFGDGFDLLFKPDQPDVVYAASQGGYLGRVDQSTGKTVLLRPVHPQDTFLRFNWNAPIAQDPNDPNTLYIGSQFVHRSTDAGQNWEIISPDLTTNDPTKQRQDISGGLTIDATQAENHTTLLAIVPATPVWNQPQTLWVSSDDGRLHISRDNGDSWDELTANLRGMTPGSWIPYIEASPHNPAEAFVVVNDYRRGDTRPMVYHTDDYGESFELVVDEEKVAGHAQAIVQDPVEPNLLFLGTDQGLWFSLDYGDTWTRHDAGFPHVSVMDLKIHPREHDLIIGTFGRAAWILDDIRPFRALAGEQSAMLQDSFSVFPAPDAYQWEYRSYQGIRFAAQGRFQGEERPYGALLTYWVMPGGDSVIVSDPDSLDVARLSSYSITIPQEIQEDIPGRETEENPYAGTTEENPNPVAKPKQKVKIHIIEPGSRDTLRTFTTQPTWGMNRVSWNLRRDGFDIPSRRERKEDADAPSGLPVLPGTYHVVMTYGDHQGETTLTVHDDPRDDFAGTAHARYARRDALTAELEQTTERVNDAWDRLQSARKSIARVSGAMGNAEQSIQDTLKARQKTLTQAIDQLEELVMEPEDAKGIQRNPTNLRAYLFRAMGYIRQTEGAPSQMARLSLAQYNQKADDYIDAVNAFLDGDMRKYREEVDAAKLSFWDGLEAARK